MAGNVPLFFADMVYKAAGEVSFPGTKTPEDTAVSFYMYLDRGMYGEAYDISLEPDYTRGGPASFKETLNGEAESFRGLTGRNEFIERLKFELGHNGSWIKLHNIRAEQIDRPCALPEWTEKIGETGVGRVSTSGSDKPKCRPVRVTGHILGACTIFSWERLVPVVDSAEGYKVLLPGTKRERQFYYQEWIMNIVKIFDLRAVDETGGGVP